MYTQTMELNLRDKIIIGLLTTLLFIGGLFASLLALAIGGAVTLLLGAKLWWQGRKRDDQVIEGRCEVVHD